MKNLVRAMCDLLDRGEKLVLVTIVESSGSTPRTSGAKMVVRESGEILGTVGGGIVEALACRDAAKLFKSGDGAVAVSDFDLTQDMAAKSDMICGGRLKVLLQAVSPEGGGARAYGRLDDLLRHGRRSSLLTFLDGGEALVAKRHCILDEDGVAHGQWPESFGEHSARAGEYLNHVSASLSEENGQKLFSEPFIPPAPLFIIGAGHVSKFTARIGAMVGFRTVVLDDRKDFANEERFPEVDEVAVLSSFKDAFGGRDVDDGAFVVIVTRGHIHDQTVLAQALKSPARYIGMIGSRKKRDAIYNGLREQGFGEDDLARCHCPIGLGIGAQTPEEIALSIGSELVSVRAGQKS